MTAASMRRIRVWDLPTRIFHWSLALGAVGMLVTAKLEDDYIVWHARLGYFMGALLMFRIIWGFAGGRWSRFSSFPPVPSRAWGYLHDVAAHGTPGHNPLGALSVYAMLVLFLLQFATGLFTDTKEEFTGPLTSLASNATVHLMTGYHKRVGQWVLIALVVLHLAAIAYYSLVRKQELVRAMLDGDALAREPVAPSRDDATTRALALALFLGCCALVWGLVQLGGG